MSEVYIRSQNKEKLYRLGGNYACVEYGEYEDVKKKRELRYGGQDNSTAITRFTLAVDDGKDTDFINIKCFGRTAEWAQKWLSKGSRAEVTGKIKTGSYESQRTGSKVYYTEVVANSVGFGESKAEAEARGQQLPESDGFMNIPEGADEELPV